MSRDDARRIPCTIESLVQPSGFRAERVQRQLLEGMRGDLSEHQQGDEGAGESLAFPRGAAFPGGVAAGGRAAGLYPQAQSFYLSASVPAEEFVYLLEVGSFSALKHFS